MIKNYKEITDFLRKMKFYYDIPLIIISSNGECEYNIIPKIQAYSCGLLAQQLLDDFSEDSVIEYFRVKGWAKPNSKYPVDSFRIAYSMVKYCYPVDYFEYEFEDYFYGMYQELKIFVAEYETKYGKDAYTSIPINYCYEVEIGKHEVIDLKVLAAIYSILGKKQKKRRITIEQIYYRMKGYKSQKVCIQEKGKQMEDEDYHRIRRITIKLASKGFYSRLTYNNRITEYSSYLEPEQLAKYMLAERKGRIEKNNRTKQLQRELNNGVKDFESQFKKVKIKKRQ